MPKPIADDFDYIRARMAEIASPEPAAEDLCPECEGAGWVQVFSHHPPLSGVCPSCLNPDDHPCP
jgi:hypothetical protein